MASFGKLRCSLVKGTASPEPLFSVFLNRTGRGSSTNLEAFAGGSSSKSRVRDWSALKRLVNKNPCAGSLNTSCKALLLLRGIPIRLGSRIGVAIEEFLESSFGSSSAW